MSSQICDFALNGNIYRPVVLHSMVHGLSTFRQSHIRNLYNTHNGPLIPIQVLRPSAASTIQSDELCAVASSLRNNGMPYRLGERRRRSMQSPGSLAHGQNILFFPGCQSTISGLYAVYELVFSDDIVWTA